MKRKFLIIILLMVLMGICIVPMVKAATAKNTIDEETVQKMVQESTAQAVNEALANQVEPEETEEVQIEETDYKGIGLIAAALSTGLACIAAGISVAVVGSSAIGAVSENPSLLGKTIIIAGLAEGIAIYGLIISIMILNKI